MATALQNLSSYDSSGFIDISEKRFGLVVAEWNRELTDTLSAGAYDTLLRHGAKPENVFRNTVPGSFELTLGAQFLAQHEEVAAGAGHFLARGQVGSGGAGRSPHESVRAAYGHILHRVADVKARFGEEAAALAGQRAGG